MLQLRGGKVAGLYSLFEVFIGLFTAGDRPRASTVVYFEMPTVFMVVVGAKNEANVLFWLSSPLLCITAFRPKISVNVIYVEP